MEGVVYHAKHHTEDRTCGIRMLCVRNYDNAFVLIACGIYGTKLVGSIYHYFKIVHQSGTVGITGIVRHHAYFVITIFIICKKLCKLCCFGIGIGVIFLTTSNMLNSFLDINIDFYIACSTI